MFWEVEIIMIFLFKFRGIGNTISNQYYNGLSGYKKAICTYSLYFYLRGFMAIAIDFGSKTKIAMTNLEAKLP